MKKRGLKKQIIVISLGGSLIVPDAVDVPFLEEFRRVINRYSKKYKFIIITGGGSVARKYIGGLKAINQNDKLQSLIGISVTRLNARLMSYFFNHDPEEGIPHTLNQVEKEIMGRNIIFCGGLEYKPNQTSDATAAQIAVHFNSIFINLTNVDGLYDKNPFEYHDAVMIPKITWKDFDIMAHARKYEPGQHFILDQTAAKIIKKEKIPTYILGKDLRQLANVLEKKPFIGTLIQE
jgi:uridylate kinase